MIEVASSIWATLDPIHDELIGLAFTLLAACVLFLFRPRVKLIYGRANNSRNIISVPTEDNTSNGNHTEIYTEKFFLQNVGSKPATNVEFVLSDFPADISVWQPRNVEYKNVEKGHCLVTIPQMAPRELVIVDCVYLNQRAAFVASVKCAECIGNEVPFWTVRRFSWWINTLIAALMFFGVAYLSQIVFKLFA
ncbi:hypothetical protein FIU92_00835 [Ruegeria sp. THAF33]|nr:hypothetical protein FIU92_00835 [Ruegeria sp. THAF33]